MAHGNQTNDFLINLTNTNIFNEEILAYMRNTWHLEM